MDNLGSRMKRNYEDVTRYMLPKRTNVILRLDGKAFHTLLAGAKKPFDLDVHSAMCHTMEYLVKNIQGAKWGYTQSDEINILLTDYDTLKSEAWFNNNLQKICSIAASMASVEFSSTYGKKGIFDCRVFTIGDFEEVKNYFKWRQIDAQRNAINATAQSLYAHDDLQGRKQDELLRMINFKTNWDNYDDAFKNGVFINEEGEHRVQCFREHNDILTHPINSYKITLTPEALEALKEMRRTPGMIKIFPHPDEVMQAIPYKPVNPWGRFTSMEPNQNIQNLPCRADKEIIKRRFLDGKIR